MSPQQIIQALQEQIERRDAHTERECAEHLSHIAWVLLTVLHSTYFVSRELNCQAGRADLTIIADRIQPGGDSRRIAYVWELKAPQLYLFELESNSQACPCTGLFKAENQLLHYYEFLANDGSFRDRWEIISNHDVYLGGIIIGRDANLVRCDDEQVVLATHLARQALRIRERIFYGRNNIHLWTWDRVLSIAESHGVSHQRITGDPTESIDVTASVPYTEPPNEEPQEEDFERYLDIPTE
ncbi:MAG: hypothetical protein JRJ03_00435 [Deltaproteobacteria bacterium]|nr:hypothetical protein [Deltaproteobacteria bacterium]